MARNPLVGRIAIFTDDPGWHGKQLCQAFAKRGYEGKYVSLTECRIILKTETPVIYLPGFEASLPDAVFVRGVPGGSLQEVVFYLDILHALLMIGVPVYNNGRAIEKSVDKGMTSFLLNHAGLKTPKTWILKNREDALTIAEQELKKGHKLISKPLFGSQGEGLRMLDKMTDLFWLTSSQGVFYLQRFIDCEGRGYSDIRVFVIFGKAVSAMRRRGKSWLNNVARGAECEEVELDGEISRLAIQATEALAMDYAGVDIIKDRNGQYSIIEVNSIPAWKGLESVCKLSIADLLADDLIDRFIEQKPCGTE